MYQPGNILYFNPFHFPNGNPSKPKYFIVLAEDAVRGILVASLPTSKDHIPNQLSKAHGCIDNEEMRFNCYFLEAGRIVSKCGSFAFPLDTYVYGEEADLILRESLERAYRPNIDFFKVAELSQPEFDSLKRCLKSSVNTKRKVKKYL